MNTSRLDGRLALVTGAGSGIGRETALLCARRGARLVICDVNEPGLAATATAAREAGAECLERRVDVSRADEMAAFAAEVNGLYGAVDLLVNNAGVGLGGGLLDTELEDWEWIVGINLMGVVHGCHHFVPAMVARGRGGHVANLGSMVGFHASPALSAYTATKFAVVGLSLALRGELHPHGIGVTAVCPGIIATAITTSSRMRGPNATPETRERVTRMYRRRNYGPERVARNLLRAVERDRAVAPVAPEAWVAYGLTRATPRLAGWVARKIAEASP
ncbi:MAG: hypothetical protein NVSMB25_15120 [Thermoleophilaceae bacterium]